jgi:GT2 family glycosyltransferase
MAETDFIVFLNNDTEVISPTWLEAMLEHAQREDVGAVGALLYFPNNTVQHGGIILGLGDLAGHAHYGFPRKSNGYMGRLKVINNFTAVTAACLMTRRSLFLDVGGFDEKLSHAFNDLDLCLKMRKEGHLIVYTPYAELYHHESLTRGYESTPEKKDRFKKEIEYFSKKWQSVIVQGDPYYNPNLTQVKSDFSLRINDG